MRLPGRLNLFQGAMLRWRALHPYGAVHMVWLRLPFDAARLRGAIAQVLEQCGLTGLELDARRRRFGFAGGPATVELSVHAGGDAPQEVTDAETERLLNLPFPAAGRFNPFRFFAVTSGPDFVLGLAYDHFIAGGDSIVLLLTDIADAYGAEVPAEVKLPVLERYPPTYARLLAANAGVFLAGLARLPGLVTGWRRAARPPGRNAEIGTNAFVHFIVTPEAHARLRAQAQAWGVTGNDVVIAMTLQAVAPLSNRRPTDRRNELAAASIVNLRRDFQPGPERVFGQFLSSFRVIHPVPAGGSLEALARDVGRQTAAAKRQKLYLQTLVAMAFGAILWANLSIHRRHRFYLKYHPVFAGITPLNANALRRRGPLPDGDYLRIVATGPVSPIVVATTTAGAVLRVGITFREAVIGRGEARGIASRMSNAIDQLPP